MDLSTLTVEQVRNERKKYLAMMEDLRQGRAATVTYSQAVAAKDEYNAELFRRGTTIKAEARLSTPESAALARTIRP